MLGQTLALAIAVALLVALLRWAARSPDPAVIARWAARHDLVLHPGDQDEVGRQLQRGRWLRTLGFVVVFVVGTGASLWWAGVYQESLPPPPLSLLTAPSAWAVGYLLGAVVTELARRDRRPRQVRTAALAPRRLADYLPAWMPRAERAVAVAILALAPLADQASSGTRWTISPGVSTAVAAVGVAILVELALRVMVRRPQLVATTTGLAIDDALRSTSIYRAAGAGLAALLFLLPNQFGSLGARGAWAVVAGLGGLLCYGLAIGCWKDLSSPLWWPIRRGVGPGQPGGPPRPEQRQEPA